MKKILVCGGRDYANLHLVFTTLDNHWCLGDEIIQGGASGADDLARRWAHDRGVKFTTFGADWEKHGRAAGPIRNQQMLDDGKPGLVIAFPGGRGTADMVRRARAAKIEVVVVKGST